VKNTNKQDDTDILRAEDIVPPYKNEHHHEQNSLTTQPEQIKDVSYQKIKKQTSKEMTSSLSINQTQYEMNANEHSDAAQKVNKIPTFNLAEQIMAEQRKITSVRRKAPGKKNKTSARRPRIESTGYDVEPQRALSEKERIIAEIVARDIDKLCRGGSSSLWNW